MCEGIVDVGAMATMSFEEGRDWSSGRNTSDDGEYHAIRVTPMGGL
jgi:hypothetical protein